jgi:hypothetical protein
LKGVIFLGLPLYKFIADLEIPFPNWLYQFLLLNLYKQIKNKTKWQKVHQKVSTPLK